MELLAAVPCSVSPKKRGYQAEFRTSTAAAIRRTARRSRVHLRSDRHATTARTSPSSGIALSPRSGQAARRVATAIRNSGARACSLRAQAQRESCAGRSLERWHEKRGTLSRASRGCRSVDQANRRACGCDAPRSIQKGDRIIIGEAQSLQDGVVEVERLASLDAAARHKLRAMARGKRRRPLRVFISQDLLGDDRRRSAPCSRSCTPPAECWMALRSSSEVEVRDVRESHPPAPNGCPPMMRSFAIAVYR